MGKYSVQIQKDGTTKYYFIRNLETYEIELLSAKYLTHKTRSNRSPNTIRRCAFSIAYYLEFLSIKGMKVSDVYKLDYAVQSEHFVKFLNWLKAGNHRENDIMKLPNNGTCNAYLKDVFGFYLFLEMECSQFGSLKVLSYNQYITPDSIGVQKTIRSKGFKGYLKEEERKVKAAEKDEIREILQACTNIRDQVLILLLAETGFRIGEILGVDYVKDIDYRTHIIGVYFRDSNENNARAKNAEYRKAKISDETFEFLMFYIAKNRTLLQHQNYLFVNLTGETVGKPLRVDAVYAMLDRMEKKTGIKITPHMLRRYFGNERRKAGWRLELIQLAYGHKHMQTTTKYLNIVDDQLLEASQEFYNEHSAIYGIHNLL